MKRFSFVISLLLACTTVWTENRHLVVKAGSAESLLQTIEEANQTNADSASERLFVLIPDGYYDLGDRVLTLVSGHNISLVGQSMEGTIIRNAPDVKNEGIGKTAVIKNTGTGLFLQDLTLRNDLAYYEGNADGRAVCLQDKGTRTICKRVCLLSHQDTYYSDNERCQHYFDESEIHGTVDFICGAGDVYFNRCTIVTEPRSLNGKGRDVIAAPRTSQTQWGYVFESCTIKNVVSDFQYARGWHTKPRMALLRTTLLSPERLLAPRYDSRGMRTVESMFYEYHTMDAEGRDITPKSNVVTFTLKDEKREHETILTPEAANLYTLKKIFPDWRPEKITKELLKKTARLKRQTFGK